MCLLFADYAVYHSLYDDFIWMEKFGDPLFQRHVAGIPTLTAVSLEHLLWIVSDPFMFMPFQSHALICWNDMKLD
jgi:N-acetylated-alpha-linked acidic dipeptidase